LLLTEVFNHKHRSVSSNASLSTKERPSTVQHVVPSLLCLLHGLLTAQAFSFVCTQQRDDAVNLGGWGEKTALANFKVNSRIFYGSIKGRQLILSGNRFGHLPNGRTEA
jgi:hypothetical protein